MNHPTHDHNERDLDELRWHWGEAYLIHRLGDRWVAQRRDTRQTISAGTADELAGLIAADYQSRPVPRDGR